VLRIRHEQSRDVDVQGASTDPVPRIVDFDNPHIGANVALRGQYPSGVIDWSEGQWKVCPPGGRMSTFNLCLSDPKVNEAQFNFAFARLLLRLDVFNPTDHEIALTLRAPEMREVTFHLKPGQLQRINTGWRDRASTVKLDADGLGQLRFDNLAYTAYLWARLNWSE
jgi:hypothetical protein